METSRFEVVGVCTSDLGAALASKHKEITATATSASPSFVLFTCIQPPHQETTSGQSSDSPLGTQRINRILHIGNSGRNFFVFKN
jgi:hypothetical protein